jgi:hypothetical protein
MSSAEFLASSESSPDDSIPVHASEEQLFLSLSLRYDPYSPTAEEDYAALKAELRQFDIVGMLGRQLAKSQIHSAMVKKLISAIRHLSATSVNAAIISLLESIDKLSPIFPNVMLIMNANFETLSAETKAQICERLREMIATRSHVMLVELNLCFAIRVLGKLHTIETEELLVRIFETTNSQIIKRDIILIMAKWGVTYWLSDIKHKFLQLRPWERRSFLIASYMLEDEGSHWRSSVKDKLAPYDIVVRDWMAKKKAIKNWKLPL